MKKAIIGTLAHVDAGKTTLSEGMLYSAGSIRTVGRVDHKDSFLDYDSQERNRGITIYSKQAMLIWKDMQITLIDTPGHVDFSSEMERTLQILDYAIIVINALDGIQVHTETIWNLLKHYEIPTFLFVNKMDITHFDQVHLQQEIQAKLSPSCVDFTYADDAWLEALSLCDDELLETYMETQTLSTLHIQSAIARRVVFPCYYGSALKMKGVRTFMDGIALYTQEKIYPDVFGAKVYKITRDEQGNKLTHVKVTGGTLKAKQKLKDDEKVDQLRIYSGHHFQVKAMVEAGQVCAIKGLKHIVAGEGLGCELDAQHAMLSSYLNYKVKLASGSDIQQMYKKFQQLAQEDPQLYIRFQEAHQEITIQLMGEIQIEVLQYKIKERFGVDVEFEQGSVVYKETITQSVEGVGHYEPLRHYAEVHLLLEPLGRNTGLIFESTCSQDVLPRQWQNLVLAHLQEKEHVGVLTGSPITDMKITLLAGKAHLKHTEGGDFREAVYRAIRQGLMSTHNILLEPYYTFTLELPRENVSRAMHDLQLRNATFELQDGDRDKTILRGSAPVAKMQNYQLEVYSYTKGRGMLRCVWKGYEESACSEDIVTQIQYDSERDVEHPSGSIFCSHGAGFFVPWNEVYDHMHIKACWKVENLEVQDTKRFHKQHIDDKEVERVMNLTYGNIKHRGVKKRVDLNATNVVLKQQKPLCYIVDGYNILHDWDVLKKQAVDNLDGAREQLIHYMSSFQGFKKCLLILVFDAYKVANHEKSEYYNGSIYVVYTKTAQSADSYIERTTHELASEYNIIVATSDGLEQLVVSGQGAARMSARELQKEYMYSSKLHIEEYESKQSKVGNRALEDLRKLNES